jgi:transcription elongation factor
VGQNVTVKSGPYTGYKGRVKQETATHVQLELDAINRIVTVKKTDVRFPGEGGPGRGGFGGFQPGRGYQPAGFQPGRGYQPGGYPNQTPLHPSATPRHPSQVRGLSWRIAMVKQSQKIPGRNVHSLWWEVPCESCRIYGLGVCFV